MWNIVLYLHPNNNEILFVEFSESSIRAHCFVNIQDDNRIKRYDTTNDIQLADKSEWGCYCFYNIMGH